MNIEELRKRLDKFINTTNLSDMDIILIYEEESKKRESVFDYKERKTASD